MVDKTAAGAHNNEFRKCIFENPPMNLSRKKKKTFSLIFGNHKTSEKKTIFILFVFLQKEWLNIKKNNEKYCKRSGRKKFQ